MQQEVIPADAADAADASSYMAALQALQAGCSAARQPQPAVAVPTWPATFTEAPKQCSKWCPLTGCGWLCSLHAAGQALAQVLGGRRGGLVPVRGPSTAATCWLPLQRVCTKAGACCPTDVPGQLPL